MILPSELKELKAKLRHWPLRYRWGISFIIQFEGMPLPLDNALLTEPAISRQLASRREYLILTIVYSLMLLASALPIQAGLFRGARGIDSVVPMAMGVLIVMLNALVVIWVQGRALRSRSAFLSRASLSGSAISASEFVVVHVLIPASLSLFVAFSLQALYLIGYVISAPYEIISGTTSSGMLSSDALSASLGLLCAPVLLAGHFSLVAGAIAFRAHALTDDIELANRRAVADMMSICLPLVILAMLAVVLGLLFQSDLLDLFFIVPLCTTGVLVFLRLRRMIKELFRELDNLAPLWWSEGADVNLDDLTKRKWLGDWTRPLHGKMLRLNAEARVESGKGL
ncbi:hypothetical protein KQI84_03265 [bacterium]|nr:hypothetical protein [bacterium]